MIKLTNLPLPTEANISGIWSVGRPSRRPCLKPNCRRDACSTFPRQPFLIFLLISAAALHAKEPVKPAPPVVDPTPAPSLRQEINSLEPTQIQKAVETLQANFLSSTSLDEASKQRALLEGLIRRLAPGVTITAPSPSLPPTETYPFLAEILDGRAGYLRPGLLDAGTLSQMDVALASFTAKKIPSVILDLRAVPRGSGFDDAAEFAKRFCPKGKLLFSIRKPSAKGERMLMSDKEPLFQGILVVLTDFDTSGAAEALAATLRANAGAMIVGSDTSGEAVEFSEFPLGNGRVLRVAVAEIVLPGNHTIFPGGVKPDIAISLAPNIQAEIFQVSREKGVSQFVFDTGRTRLSEAALVANTNPEIESSEAQKEKGRLVLHDTVLQRAVDLVTAISFYKK